MVSDLSVVMRMLSLCYSQVVVLYMLLESLNLKKNSLIGENQLL